jgi:Spy/CpxP family protein refolding chaperone
MKISWLVFLPLLVLCFTGKAISQVPDCNMMSMSCFDSSQNNEDTPGPDTSNDSMFQQQGKHRGGPGGPGGPGEQMGRGFEQLRMKKMLELLNLTDAEKDPFRALFRDMRNEQRNFEKTKRGFVDEISELVKNQNPDQKKLNGLCDQLMTLEDERRLNMRGFIEKVRTLLTPLQMGQFIVFQEKFDEAILNFMREGGKHNLRKGMQGENEQKKKP